MAQIEHRRADQQAFGDVLLAAQVSPPQPTAVLIPESEIRLLGLSALVENEMGVANPDERIHTDLSLWRPRLEVKHSLRWHLSQVLGEPSMRHDPFPTSPYGDRA
jgi:hypothetical protein